MVAAEALVRWRQEDGSLKYPGPWLDLVQNDAQLCLDFSCRAWGSIAAAAVWNPHISFAVNTMPSRIALEGWGEMAVDRLGRLGIDPWQVIFEVVEGALLQDTAIVRHNLTHLREAGCRVALDDFGDGNSNLVTFMAFESLIDTVKIDQKLIRHPDHRAAAALIHLGHSFGKHIVAEGVETEGQALWLASLGVSTIQGWLYAKAMPLSQLTTYINERRSYHEEGAVYAKATLSQLSYHEEGAE